MAPRIAIFGGGRVGQALAAELPGVPVYRRAHGGRPAECDYALICWPAQAIKEFALYYPEARTTHKVAFANGCWAVEDGADEHGCCYVRAVNPGDRAAPGYKGWRVAAAGTTAAMRAAGAGVVCSRADHAAHLWGKALYILPLALACDELGVTAREASATSLWAEWYAAVLDAAQEATGGLPAPQMQRAAYLLERLPKGWRPSASAAECAYFRARLGM